jgi:26S proteasome regulatory subunit N5
MSDGALKPEKDFSKEVDQQLPEAEKLAQVRCSALLCRTTGN